MEKEIKVLKRDYFCMKCLEYFPTEAIHKNKSNWICPNCMNQDCFMNTKEWTEARKDAYQKDRKTAKHAEKYPLLHPFGQYGWSAPALIIVFIIIVIILFKLGL